MSNSIKNARYLKAVQNPTELSPDGSDIFNIPDDSGSILCNGTNAGTTYKIKMPSSSKVSTITIKCALGTLYNVVKNDGTTAIMSIDANANATLVFSVGDWKVLQHSTSVSTTDSGSNWVDGKAYDADVSFVVNVTQTTAVDKDGKPIPKGKQLLSYPTNYTSNGTTLTELAKMELIGSGGASSSDPQIDEKAGIPVAGDFTGEIKEIIDTTNGEIYINQAGTPKKIGGSSTLDTTNFNKILSPNEDDMQKAFDKLDDLGTFRVDLVTDLAGITGMVNGDRALVKDTRRGGVFIYDDTAGVDDNGVTFNKWVRDFKGVVYFSWFIADLASADQTDDIISAIRYMQHGYYFEYVGTYDKSEFTTALTAIESSKDRKTIVVDGEFRYTKTLTLLGGFEITTPASYGTYENIKNCLIKTNVSDIGLTTTAIRYNGTKWEFFTLSTLESSIAGHDTSINNTIDDLIDLTKYDFLSRNLTIKANLGWKEGTKIGFLFGSPKSKIYESKIGLNWIGAERFTPDVALVVMMGWKSTISETHLCAKRQPLAVFRTNSSCSINDVYGTSRKPSGYQFKPENTTYIGADDIVGSYLKHSSVAMNDFTMELSLKDGATIGKAHFYVCDYKSKPDFMGSYAESHYNSHWGKASFSVYNNSRINVHGGFVDKSNISGATTVYCENIGVDYPSTINTNFDGDGGRLIEQINSSNRVSFSGVGLGVASTRYIATSGKVNLDTISIEGYKPSVVFVRNNNDIELDGTVTLEEAIELCNIYKINRIETTKDITLTANIDLNKFWTENLFIKCGNGKKINLNGFSFVASEYKKINNISIETATFEGNGANNIIFNNSGMNPLNITTYYCTFNTASSLYGTSRNFLTRSNVTLSSCTLTNFTGTSLVKSTDTANKCIDPTTLYVNNYDTNELIALGITNPMLNMPKGVFYDKHQLNNGLDPSIKITDGVIDVMYKQQILVPQGDINLTFKNKRSGTFGIINVWNPNGHNIANGDTNIRFTDNAFNRMSDNASYGLLKWSCVEFDVSGDTTGSEDSTQRIYVEFIDGF